MIQWGALQGGGFQNALATGLQFGQVARQRQDAKEERNALAAYAKDPNEANFGALADVRPDLAISERGRQEQAQKAAIDERNKQLGTFRQLLTAAGDNPQQAFAAAQSMGMDLSNIPQPGTAEFEPWRQQQLFIVDALSDPEKLDQIDRDVRRLGYTPETPGYEAAVRELILFSRGKQGTDEHGRPVYDLPNIAQPGQQAAPPTPQPAPQPSGEVMDFAAYRSSAATLGPEKAARFVQRLVQGGVSFRVSTPDEARQLPSGTPIILPDGTPGVVP